MATRIYIYIYIYIYSIFIKSHWLHRFPWLSLAIHPYHLLLPAGLPDNILCPYRAVVSKFWLVIQHWHIHVKGFIGESYLWVHPFFSSSVLHMLFVLFGWFLDIGDRWPYNCCFMRCCFQDLFNIAHGILVQFLSSFFSIRFVSIHVVHPYSRIDTTTAWKKFRFILSDRSDFHMINSLSIAVHAFARHALMALSVDETLLLRYMNLFTNFRELPSKMEMSPTWLKYMYSISLALTMEANATCCILQAIEHGFGLGKCICKQPYVICIVCILLFLV